MNSVIFLYAAVAIDAALCVKWHFDDKREAEQERQAEAHRQQLDETRRAAQKADAPVMPRIKTTVAAAFRHRYDVVGESFNNDDGTSRQDILAAIANCEPPYEDCKVSIDEFDFQGERALAVKVNGAQIGCIARKDLDDVFEDLISTEEITLRVFGGENGKSYGASVTLIANADI